jgi:hypothetical protein
MQSCVSSTNLAASGPVPIDEDGDFDFEAAEAACASADAPADADAREPAAPSCSREDARRSGLASASDTHASTRTRRQPARRPIAARTFGGGARRGRASGGRRLPGGATCPPAASPKARSVGARVSLTSPAKLQN